MESKRMRMIALVHLSDSVYVQQVMQEYIVLLHL